MPISPSKTGLIFMKFIQRKPRNQQEMHCLIEHAGTEIELRLIDLVVDSLNLSELGLKTQYEENARPAHALKGIGLPFFSLSAAV